MKRETKPEPEPRDATVCDRCGRGIAADAAIEHDEWGMVCDDCSCKIHDEECESDEEAKPEEPQP